jgi:hypothetical protein
MSSPRIHVGEDAIVLMGDVHQELPAFELSHQPADVDLDRFVAIRTEDLFHGIGGAGEIGARCADETDDELGLRGNSVHAQELTSSW